MPQKSQDNMKGTSPSPNIQRGIDIAWGAQQKDNTTAQQALAQKHTATDSVVPVKGA
jgi:hypothetical protein